MRNPLGRYVLIGQTPVPEPDLIKWGQWFENAENRQVFLTEIGNLTVSTVFLGLDHSFSRGGPPILFETMVFPGCEICERCATWLEAEAQHKRIVADLEREAREIAQLHAMMEDR